MGDGREWLIPPVEDGVTALQVRSELFQTLTLIDVLDRINPPCAGHHYTELRLFPEDDAVRRSVEALKRNYDIDDDDVERLRLLDSGAVQRVCEAMFDVGDILEYRRQRRDCISVHQQRYLEHLCWKVGSRDPTATTYDYYMLYLDQPINPDVQIKAIESNPVLLDLASAMMERAKKECHIT